MRTLLVIDGNKSIKKYQKEFRQIIKQYKEVYKGWGITYKTVKPKTAKKPYQYWYKWEYSPETKNNVWTYLGKEKPHTDIPDPPISRLDGVNYQVMGDNIMISEEDIDSIRDLFEGCQMFEVNPV